MPTMIKRDKKTRTTRKKFPYKTYKQMVEDIDLQLRIEDTPKSHLAEKIGVSNSTVWNFFTGEAKGKVSVRTVKKFTDYFGLEWDLVKILLIDELVS